MSFWMDEEWLDDGICLITPHGPLDSSSYETLETALLDAQRERRSKIIIDLSDVPRLSSVGVGVLISCQSDLSSKNGGGLVLVAPQREVLHVFDVMQYTEIFTIRPTVDEAVEALN